MSLLSTEHSFWWADGKHHEEFNEVMVSCCLYITRGLDLQAAPDDMGIGEQLWAEREDLA